MDALQLTSANQTPDNLEPDFTEQLTGLAVSDPLAAIAQIRVAHREVTRRIETASKPLSQQEQQTLAACRAIDEALWKVSRTLEPLIPDAGGLAYLNDWTE